MLKIIAYARMPLQAEGSTGFTLSAWVTDITEIKDSSEVEYLLNEVTMLAEQQAMPLKFKGPALLLIEEMYKKVDLIFKPL